MEILCKDLQLVKYLSCRVSDLRNNNVSVGAPAADADIADTLIIKCGEKYIFQILTAADQAQNVEMSYLNLYDFCDFIKI